MSLIFSDPDGTRPVNIALKSVLLPWLIAIGMRGMRAATGPGDSEGAVQDHAPLNDFARWPLETQGCRSITAYLRAGE